MTAQNFCKIWCFSISVLLVTNEDTTHQRSANVCSEKTNVYNHDESTVIKTSSNVSAADKKKHQIEDEMLTATRYVEIIDDDNDEEGVENPYGDMYINEEATFDVPISELQKDIIQKRKKEDEGFKREYAVSKPIWKERLNLMMLLL